MKKKDVVFDTLECAANSIIWFCAQRRGRRELQVILCTRKSTLLERSKLAATTEVLTKFRNLLSNNDVFEPCARKRVKTEWKLYKKTFATFFAALLKEVPSGCRGTVLQDPLLKRHTVKCLAFEESTRKPYNDNLNLVKALALHLHGNERLEKEIFNQADIYLYDIDIVDVSMIGELARRNVGKHSNTDRFLRYINHTWHLSNINALFKVYRCSS